MVRDPALVRSRYWSIGGCFFCVSLLVGAPFAWLVLRGCGCPSEHTYYGAGQEECGCEGGLFECAYRCPGPNATAPPVCYREGAVAACDDDGASS